MAQVLAQLITGGGAAETFPLASAGPRLADGAAASHGVEGVLGPSARAAKVDEQRWLLLLRLIKRGVYSLLAKEYESDVQLLRTISSLASHESRRELTMRSLDEMRTPEAQAHFARTVRRITDNLSVQRDARDVELHAKMLEIQRYVESAGVSYDSGEYSAL